MALLRVTHETRYSYDSPIEIAQHLAHLEPSCEAGQRLREFRLDIDPTPSAVERATDSFGNLRHYFVIDRAHSELVVCARSTVQTSAASAPQPAVAWESLRDALGYRVGNVFDPASEFCFASAYCSRETAFADYARPSFTSGRDLAAAAKDLMQRIHADFRYAPAATEVGTTAREALSARKGVCQDFAHVLIAALRSLGLAARYVSGYLLTQAPPGRPRLIGADASHAWAEVYLGQGAWLGLCPTNNRQPGEDFVALARGRDYADVPPLRGVLRGGERHQLRVAVTVEPI